MIGRVLGHYRVLERIGAGGMGEVYRARDDHLDRDVALKVLSPGRMGNETVRKLLRKEARALSRLSHPNIAAVHDFDCQDGVDFLVMELIPGQGLEGKLLSGPLPEKEVLRLGGHLARGLMAAHRHGVVHRDLKPSNLRLSEDGTLKILDFGLAVVAAAATDSTYTTATAEPAFAGTVPYMAPEQIQGLPVDQRSDIYAMGNVLYEMATGKRPFAEVHGPLLTEAILHQAPPSPRQQRPDLSPGLESVILRALEKDPERRYQTTLDLLVDLERLTGPAAVTSAPVRKQPRRWPGMVATAGALAACGMWWLELSARDRWVRNQALPQLEAIVDRIQFLQEGRECWDAFMLARRIEVIAPDEPRLLRLRPKFSREVTITSDPPGATVSARFYAERDAERTVLGTTPLVRVLYPRGFTSIQLTLGGRVPVDDVVRNFDGAGSTWSYRLRAPGEGPHEMVVVPAGAYKLYMPGLDGLEAEPTTTFLVDRHEVSQREYKRFVDAGGYTAAKYWQQPFVERGRRLSWNEAMSRFTDRIGQPGPATWEVGSFPEGGGDLPVGGVSWYEAAAYAEWAGKSLPTIFHWSRVAFTVASSQIAPLANLAGKGPVAVGSTRSMNRFGAYDLAGNVREWAWNASDPGESRFILGGGWSDPDYAFVDAYAQSAFDRSPTNGFRCIRYLEREPNLTKLERAIDRPFRDFRSERPASDALFAQYLRQFAYDKTPLDAVIEEERLTATGLRQKITFNAAYAGERMMAYLFLPPAGRPPFQVVIVFPGSGSITTRSSASLDLGRLDFLPKSGRAVMFPIYKGTYERGGNLQSDVPAETTTYKDLVIMWGKDQARSIDYLETRQDLDAGRIAYYGLSWGAALGAILPAVEKRIKTNVLYVAGLSFQRALPEADAINYVGRVTQPTLILNGELDYYFPVETSQRPMFDLLGTPAEHKKRLVFSGGHSVPRTEQIKESLRWLDRYLGPVGSGTGL